MLRAAVVVVVTAMLALGLAESVFFAVVDQGLHKPVTFLGLLQSAMGVGAVVGGILITVLIRRTGELRPVSVGIGLVAAGAALSMVPSAWVVGGAMVLIGAGLPVTVICITTILQRRTPSEIQGRVFTTFEMLTGVPQVTSIAVGAALVAFVDFRVLLTVMAVGLALASAYAAVRLREDGTPRPCTWPRWTPMFRSSRPASASTGPSEARPAADQLVRDLAVSTRTTRSVRTVSSRRRSCVTRSSVPSYVSSACSSASIAARSRWFVGSSSTSRLAPRAISSARSARVRSPGDRDDTGRSTSSAPRPNFASRVRVSATS